MTLNGSFMDGNDILICTHIHVSHIWQHMHVEDAIYWTSNNGSFSGKKSDHGWQSCQAGRLLARVQAPTHVHPRLMCKLIAFWIYILPTLQPAPPPSLQPLLLTRNCNWIWPCVAEQEASVILLCFKTSMAITLLVPRTKCKYSTNKGEVLKDSLWSPLENKGMYMPCSCASQEI